MNGFVFLTPKKDDRIIWDVFEYRGFSVTACFVYFLYIAVTAQAYCVDQERSQNLLLFGSIFVWKRAIQTVTGWCLYKRYRSAPFVFSVSQFQSCRSDMKQAIFTVHPAHHICMHRFSTDLSNYLEIQLILRVFPRW